MPGTFGVTRRGDGFRIVWYFDARDQTRAFTISYTLRRRRGRIRRRRRRQPQGLGGSVGRAARPTRRDRERARPHPPRLGQARLGARGRRAHRAAGDAPRRLGSCSPVRRAADADPALRLHLDARHEGRQRERVRPNRRRRRRPTQRATSGTRSRSTGSRPTPSSSRRSCSRSGRSRHCSSSQPCTGSSAGSAERPTIASTSRSRRRTPSRRSCPRSSARVARRARTSSRRRCSTSFEEASTSPSRRRPSARSGAVSDRRRCLTSSSRPELAQDLRPWERDVADVVDAVLDGSSERLSRFRDRIEDERESMHPRFTAFKEAVGARGRATALVPVDRRGATHHGGRALRSSRRSARLPRPGRMAPGLPALLRRAARGSGDLHAGKRGTRRRVGDLRAQDLAPSRTGAPRRRPSAGTLSAATSPTSHACMRRHLRRSSSGSATSYTESHSGSPSACCRVRSSTCPRPSTRRAPSTGSRRAATSARARRASRSATLARGSAMRSPHRTRVPAEVEEASPAGEAAEAEAAAEGSAESRPARSQRAIWCHASARGTLRHMNSDDAGKA